MASAAADAPSPAWQAALLLRAARCATLATVTGGQPFASLVTPATAPDRAILLFLSDLSEHTRHLNADPRCSLLVAGAAESANPQTAPRLTITGLAERDADPALKQSWLARHPYAALYAGFQDFALWRVTPLAGLLVAGFARATRLRRADLAPDPEAVAAIAAAAADIIGHCNADHTDALAAIAGGGEWRMVAVDVDGCDLAPPGEAPPGQAQVRRIAWSAPVHNPGSVRAELIRLARRARESPASG